MRLAKLNGPNLPCYRGVWAPAFPGPFSHMTSITAIIPVFNRAGKVTRAIQSALDQELPDGVTLDVLIVDDGSSDGLDSSLAA